MTKIVKIFTVFFLVGLLLLNGKGISAFAANDEGSNYKETVKGLIQNYDEVSKNKSQTNENDGRFVNDMVENQQKLEAELQQKIKEAKAKGEKFYTYDEILASKASDFNIPEEDLKNIKAMVLNQKNDLTNLLNEFNSLGQSNHPIAVKIKKELNKGIPKSEIFIDHSVEKDDSQGVISGGGWPYCLDNNGWGYNNFITSDCYKAIVAALICASDSTLGHMNYNLRYCKAYIRNCSPIIGHSKYWHTHPWYQQIP